MRHRGGAGGWKRTAHDEDALDRAIAELMERSGADGEWNRMREPPCDGGEICTHLPKVIE